MWQNSRSIAIVLKNGGLGLALKKIVEVASSRTSENSHFEYSMYLFHLRSSC